MKYLILVCAVLFMFGVAMASTAFWPHDALLVLGVLILRAGFFIFGSFIAFCAVLWAFWLLLDVWEKWRSR